MPNITHTTSRPSSPKSKVLVVRQPVKSVRREEHPDRLPMRLAIGVIVAIGSVGAVWLMGHLGYRLGFAPLVGVPALTGEPDLGLATGARMISAVPRVIFRTGLDQPMWLMTGFAMVALPAALLGAAKPLTPGGPRLKSSFVVLASCGAALTMLCGALLLWWTLSPARAALLSPLPAAPAEAGAWYASLQIAAGLDVLALITAALWAVLSMRLPIPLWLRALTASVAIFTLVVVAVAASMSGAAQAQAGATRAVCMLDDAADGGCLMLGNTPDAMALLLVDEGRSTVELRNHPTVITITGSTSIAQFLDDRAEELARP